MPSPASGPSCTYRQHKSNQYVRAAKQSCACLANLGRPLSTTDRLGDGVHTVATHTLSRIRQPNSGRSVVIAQRERQACGRVLTDRSQFRDRDAQADTRATVERKTEHCCACTPRLASSRTTTPPRHQHVLTNERNQVTETLVEDETSSCQHFTKTVHIYRCSMRTPRKSPFVVGVRRSRLYRSPVWRIASAVVGYG